MKTPETDHIEQESSLGIAVPADFARTLERQRDAYREQRDEALRENTNTWRAHSEMSEQLREARVQRDALLAALNGVMDLCYKTGTNQDDRALIAAEAAITNATPKGL